MYPAQFEYHTPGTVKEALDLLGRHKDDAKLLAVGLTTLLGFQVFVIAGGVVRLIPLTGVPLPLVSYGGTSRVATFVLLALLMRASAGPFVRSRRG